MLDDYALPPLTARIHQRGTSAFVRVQGYSPHSSEISSRDVAADARLPLRLDDDEGETEMSKAESSLSEIHAVDPNARWGGTPRLR